MAAHLISDYRQFSELFQGIDMLCSKES